PGSVAICTRTERRAEIDRGLVARDAVQCSCQPTHCGGCATRGVAGVMASLVFDTGLVLLVMAVAGWAILARDPFAAVVGFVVYGLLLALVWVRLAAVDVALTEAAIGSGLTGTLLLGAAARLRGDEAPAAERPGPLLRFAATLLSACVAAGLAGAILRLPENAPTLAPAAAQNAAATGLGNPVTNVLMAFRAMDT